MPKLQKAAPVLASLDMNETIAQYTEQLGFRATYHDDNYGIVVRDTVAIHFWKANDKIHPENTSCYVDVADIDALFAEMQAVGVVHPNGQLENKPWGMREFAILDVHGNMIKFGETLR